MTASTRRRSVEFLADWSDPLDPCGDARWLFGGEEREVNDYDNVVIFLDDLEKCTATDLQAAMRRARRFCEHRYDPVVVAVTQENFYEKEILPTEDLRFELLDNHLTFSIVLGFDPGDDERDSQPLVRSVLDPLLRRHRMTIVRFESQEAFPYGSFVLHTTIGFNTRERTLRELYDIGQDAHALFEAKGSGQLTRETAGDLIRGGHANVLIGQPEGHWLDVKKQHYDMNTRVGKIKLAESVSRFCNTEGGGLVVFGMAGKKVPGGEEIRRLCPMPRDKAMIGRYQRALEEHLFPPPDNMSIEVIEMPDDGMLILIDVPPQPEELKPFLVHGAVVDGEVEGAFISIVRRRGESSIPITAPMIHSMLAAGRALLRRGELPPDT